MAEVGLVRFAQVAMEITTAALPPYRSKFSKHIFTQPQLLALLCLMRYEDWTFREVEVRLSEHSELRDALGLGSVPDYTTLYRFMRRLDEQILERVLAEAVGCVPPPPGGATLAVDGTGLESGAISTFFVNRVRDRGGGLPWRHYLKWVVVVDVRSQLVVAQIAKQGPSNDSANLRPLVDAASARIPVQRVLADAEFDSERNHTHIREVIKADSVIPAKRGKPTWRLNGVRAQMRADFPKTVYAQRSLVETVFSVIKRKLSSRAPGRSLQTQSLQCLVLGLAYDIYRLRPRADNLLLAPAASLGAT